MRFPLHGETLREPRPIRERPHLLKHHPSMQYVRNLDERINLLKELVREQFAGRQPAVLRWHEQPLVMRHSKDAEGKCQEHCSQCRVAQRNAETGRPMMQFVLDIERNHLWRTVVGPKRHKNPRQQKKWAKLDVVEERPVREVQKWILTPLQFRVLRELWPTL